MKLINRKVQGKVITLYVEKSYIFGLVKRKLTYSSNKAYTKNYREWVKEPNKTLVPDRLSFQLDAWNNSFNDA